MSLLVRIISKNVVRPQSTALVRQWQSNPVARFHILKTVQSSQSLCRSRLITNTSLMKRLLSSAAHDHTKIWVVEKVVSASLLVVIPAALLYPNPILDYLLALSLVMHVHWGLEAMVVDYIRPSLFGNAIPKVALAATYLLSMIALAGLFYLNYSDVGTATAIKMFAKA